MQERKELQSIEERYAKAIMPGNLMRQASARMVVPGNVQAKYYVLQPMEVKMPLVKWLRLVVIIQLRIRSN